MIYVKLGRFTFTLCESYWICQILQIIYGISGFSLLVHFMIRNLQNLPPYKRYSHYFREPHHLNRLIFQHSLALLHFFLVIETLFERIQRYFLLVAILCEKIYSIPLNLKMFFLKSLVSYLKLLVHLGFLNEVHRFNPLSHSLPWDPREFQQSKIILLFHFPSQTQLDIIYLHFRFGFFNFQFLELFFCFFPYKYIFINVLN